MADEPLLAPSPIWDFANRADRAGRRRSNVLTRSRSLPTLLKAGIRMHGSRRQSIWKPYRQPATEACWPAALRTWQLVIQCSRLPRDVRGRCRAGPLSGAGYRFALNVNAGIAN